jgi:hypothetical protein
MIFDRPNDNAHSLPLMKVQMDRGLANALSVSGFDDWVMVNVPSSPLQ